MEMGSYKIAEDKDFKRLKDMVDDNKGWNLEFSGPECSVWTRENENTTIRTIKVISTFEHVNPDTLYDVIHDTDYRNTWDHSMIESRDIGHLNPNNDLCYFAVSCPSPLSNRDFVLQRSWLDTGRAQYIINRSVFHKDYPPKRGFTRGISLFTGYLIRRIPKKDGCVLAYVTQSDLQGDLPQWLVNKCTKILAPKYIKSLEKAAVNYPTWKAKNRPHYKPWIYPEQIKSPRIHPQAVDIVPEVKSPITKAPLLPSGSLFELSPKTSPIIDEPISLSLQDSLHDDQSSRRKLRLLSCLNFTKHCLGRNHEAPMP